MERPLWDRIQEIYYSTLPMPRSERSAFVASACDHDPFLVREVTSLLTADDSSGGFLESPVFELGLRIISTDSANKSGKANGSTRNLIGTTIDAHYLVERALGHGGIGKVYFARDLKLHNKPVVIKVLLDASVKDAYVVKKFRQEVEALARIDHPNVVSVLGAGELPDGKPFIVMQYVSGVTLRSQIPIEGMDLERAASILKQIGAALDDVHEKGIFHRDLKPENIMLQSLKGGADLVKVVDFGIAKVKDSVIAPSTVDNVPIGTVVYMSPEQLRGRERITATSDIYSMGVIAYEMVTGRRPFNPTSAPQLLEMHREGVRVMPVHLRPSLSTEAQAIILRALSFDRTARFQSAAEFGDGLALALMNEDETAEASVRPLSTKPDGSKNASVKNDHPFRLGKSQLVIIGGFFLVLFGVLGVLWIIKQTSAGEAQSNANAANTPHTANTANTNDMPPLPARSFIFSLTVRKRMYGNAFQSTGKDIFAAGDRFRLNVLSSTPGYVYVFNEGTPEPNRSSFTIIYPVPGTNIGSASVGANQWARTGWNTFGGEPGTENLWITWSTTSLPILEAAKTEAFNNKGMLTGQTLHAVKAFLQAKEEESKPRISREKTTQQTTVRGHGDVIVKMVPLEHR